MHKGNDCGSLRGCLLQSLKIARPRVVLLLLDLIQIWLIPLIMSLRSQISFNTFFRS
jgi:hypothetical protein